MGVEGWGVRSGRSGCGRGGCRVDSATNMRTIQQTVWRGLGASGVSGVLRWRHRGAPVVGVSVGASVGAAGAGGSVFAGGHAFVGGRVFAGGSVTRGGHASAARRWRSTTTAGKGGW